MVVWQVQCVDKHPMSYTRRHETVKERGVQRWVVQKTSSFWLFSGMLLTPKTEAA